ncbi:flagella locus protein FlaG [Alishewanella longhuensis]|uniref:Flagella locus protein FlaG n=1 Tax=Alishewanella longhuensis TaxID=1091037 RepID=A0ABQ3KY82_9ALTE|nr:flagellar protein FlaG [Alishewanella longhuensis]GHG69220.1 flagella locus protein FlaG [Alishewanella longhuensis]
MNTIPNTAGVSLNQVNAEYKFANNETTLKPAVSSESVLPSQVQTIPSTEQVTEALNVVNKAAVFEQRSLSFMMDETSGRSIIKVMDKSTDQVIRQIPSEELLKVAQDIKRLQEEMGQSLGFLIDRKV